MNPREFIRDYRYDGRLVTGQFFPVDPIAVCPGDHVGIVLLHAGGPLSEADVQQFMYQVLMDPVLIDLPLGRRLRHYVCRIVAPFLAKSARREYGAIGGRALVNRLMEEQARALETVLNRTVGADQKATFHTYLATRYGHPTGETVGRQIEQDGIEKIVFLPLYPQYAKAYSGSSLLHWWMLQEHGLVPKLPSTYVFEYAGHPKYIQAINDRIDEALQRFPRAVRSNVHLLFSAQGTPLRDMSEFRDPYCCLVHGTVSRVMASRKEDRPFHLSFQSAFGWMEWLDPGTSEQLEKIAKEGHRAVLVVPISQTADCLETVFRLDVQLREQADKLGLTHIEVASGINCHPLFIETLSEVAVSKMSFSGSEATAGRPPAASYSLCPVDIHVRQTRDPRNPRCLTCPVVVESRNKPGSTGGKSTTASP